MPAGHSRERHSEDSIRLETETPVFAWGYEGRQVRVGNYTFYLRFKASRRLRHNRSERALDIGFAGRLEKPTENRQVAWGNKLFTAANWRAFARMSVTGTTYSHATETVSPLLLVTAEPAGSPDLT